MAQGGFTPIQLYHSTTGAAVPSAGNLANGELAINILDGKLYYKNNAGAVTLFSGAPAGSTTQIQYNNAGVLAGSSALTLVSSTLTTSSDASIAGLTVGRGGGAILTNTTLGSGAFAANASGTSNVAIGRNALAANTITLGNVAVGASALGLYNRTSNGTGRNTAIGQSAMGTSSDGTVNVAVGYSSLAIATGSGNTCLGSSSGAGITSGGSNVILGAYQGAAAPISATGSNYIVFSDGGANVRAYFNGADATFNGLISPQQATTAGAPAYVLGAMYFDTTLNKLRIGGATGWETVTSV